MHAEPATEPASPAGAGQPDRFLVARHTAKRVVRSAVVWAYVFAVFVASSALTYSRFYKTAADRERLEASFGANHASSALFGPAPRLETVAGFTVLKVSMSLMIIGAVWGLLTSTRLLRGEEDAGRAELLFAGATTRRGATVQTLAGLGAGAGTLFTVTALVTVLVGRSSAVGFAVGPSLFFALALVATGVMFLAVGAVTSQLAPTRRQAAAWASIFLGLSYAIRMVADAGVGLHVLVWASPLGWVEELSPLTSPRPLALVPIGLFTGVLSTAAVLLADRRDLGSSVVRDRDTAVARLGLLSGPTGLALRLTRATVTGWAAAIAAAGLLLGIVAKAAGTTISGSSVEEVFRRLGSPGTGASAFLGVSFLILAILVGFVAAGQITAVRSEEAEGRLDHLLVRPVGRTRFLAGRLGLAVAILVGEGILAGLFTWLGEAGQRPGVGVGELLLAGVNLVPPAVFVLGAGALAVGLRPRAAAGTVYGLLVWSLLVSLIGGVASQSHWLLDTSVFHQMASAPAVHPNWQVNAVMAALGLAAMTVALAAFRRRDLAGE